MSETQSAPAEAVTLAETSTAEADPQPEMIKLTPAALAARLERAQKKVLADLGVEKVDDAKAAIAELKKRQDAEKTESERLRAQIAELESKAKRASPLESVLAVKVASELETLTEAQRAAVNAIAGADPGEQLKAIEALKPTWAQAARPQPAPLPPPANTAPAQSAPSAGAASTDNHLATWEALKKSNPIAAAYYLDAHQVEIVNAKKARES